jgi:hypothetical protein
VVIRRSWSARRGFGGHGGLAVLALLVFCVPARALADPPVRVPAIIDATAVPTTSPITIDGQLNEPVWEQAPSVNEFVQREPAEGPARMA